MKKPADLTERELQEGIYSSLKWIALFCSIAAFAGFAIIAFIVITSLMGTPT